MNRLLGVALFLLPLAVSADPQFATPRAKVTFGDGTVVTVELASTPAAQQRGLMFRKSLAEREGMLFVFDTPDFRPFWMQNCLIALDIIWVDEASTIVSIAESVPPCKMAGCDPPCASDDCPQIPAARRNESRSTSSKCKPALPRPTRSPPDRRSRSTG